MTTSKKTGTITGHIYNDDGQHWITFREYFLLLYPVDTNLLIPDHMDDESTEYSDGYLVEVEYDTETKEVLRFDRSFGGYP